VGRDWPGRNGRPWGRRKRWSRGRPRGRRWRLRHSLRLTGEWKIRWLCQTGPGAGSPRCPGTAPQTAPQRAQKPDFASTGWPQSGQTARPAAAPAPNGVPHAPQNLAPSGSSCQQFGQRINTRFPTGRHDSPENRLRMYGRKSCRFFQVVVSAPPGLRYEYSREAIAMDFSRREKNPSGISPLSRRRRSVRCLAASLSCLPRPFGPMGLRSRKTRRYVCG
jgi:hypothetical protein